jgi:hypothetical protein
MDGATAPVAPEFEKLHVTLLSRSAIEAETYVIFPGEKSTRFSDLLTGHRKFQGFQEDRQKSMGTNPLPKIQAFS